MLQNQCVSVTDLRTNTKECLKDIEKEPKYVFFPNILRALHSGDHHHVYVLPVFDLSDYTKVGYELLTRMSIEGFEVADDFFRFCLEHNILTLVDHRCFESCMAAGTIFPPACAYSLNLNVLPCVTEPSRSNTALNFLMKSTS